MKLPSHRRSLSTSDKRRLRLKLMKRQRGRCAGCSQDLTLKPRRENSATIDHVIPLSRGGTNQVGNLQLMCPACNGAKSDASAVADLFETSLD